MAQSESGERTAFVLAGGGSLGAVQVGMLAELIGAGVRPDVIVGVSAGALNGAFLAFDSGLKMVEQRRTALPHVCRDGCPAARGLR